jgi:tRNA(Arg) A34 adenosine deaminase TadA
MAPSESDRQHSEDEHWMALALEQAELAANAGEVPVGAVLVEDGKLLATGFNQPITAVDATAHAEIVALRAAARSCGNYRLPRATLYVTIEPCSMCAGALVHARIKRVVFGARESKAGALLSQSRFFESGFLNHRPEFEEGVLAEQCAQRMQDFFRQRRQQKQQLRQAGANTEEAGNQPDNQK